MVVLFFKINKFNFYKNTLLKFAFPFQYYKLFNKGFQQLQAFLNEKTLSNVAISAN